MHRVKALILHTRVIQMSQKMQISCTYAAFASITILGAACGSYRAFLFVGAFLFILGFVVVFFVYFLWFCVGCFSLSAGSCIAVQRNMN